jgi:hypothetical protein
VLKIEIENFVCLEFKMRLDATVVSHLVHRRKERYVEEFVEPTLFTAFCTAHIKRYKAHVFQQSSRSSNGVIVSPLSHDISATGDSIVTKLQGLVVL